jgi:rubrerythrin
MQFYRCRICGETYLGTEPPSRCPFCGVTADYFVLTGDYDEDINRVGLTDVEREDIMAAIEIERSNARFYRALGTRSDDLKLASAYKRLSSVEAEHCSVFSKLAGVTKPADLTEPGDGATAWCADIAESLAREKRASAFYAQAAARATTPRVVEVLAAVSAVEVDHIALDGVASAMAGCEDAGAS